jgi:hypothetical protein
MLMDTGHNLPMDRKKLEKCYLIYEQIFNDPKISIYALGKNTRMSRNTVFKYLKEMIARRMLTPPYLELRPAKNHHEYFHFLTFRRSQEVYSHLERFPSLISRWLCMGQWNLMVRMTAPLDFSQLQNFSDQLFYGKKGRVVTPLCGIHGGPHHTRPVRTHEKDRKIPWTESQWRLFHLLQYEVRSKIFPLLRREHISHHEYSAWKKTVPEYCSVHTLWYPLGFDRYSHWLFLMKGDLSICSYFSGWSASCIFYEVHPFVLGVIPFSSPIREREDILKIKSELDRDYGEGYCALLIGSTDILIL